MSTLGRASLSPELCKAHVASGTRGAVCCSMPPSKERGSVALPHLPPQQFPHFPKRVTKKGHLGISIPCPRMGGVDPGSLCPRGSLCPWSRVPGITPTSPSLHTLRLCGSVAPSHFSPQPHNSCPSLLASSDPLAWPSHLHLLCLQ